MANEKHVELLRQGVADWNAWRKTHPSIKPDLKGAVLNGIDLKGADLMEANLEEAMLIGAKFDGANLAKAELYRANLSEAHLNDAGLSFAKMAETILVGAHLRCAILIGAFLHKANLEGAELNWAVLNNAHLENAICKGAIFDDAILAWADLSEADLSGASLVKADLERARLVKTNLNNANLTSSRVYGISAWDLIVNEGTTQQDLIVSPEKDEDEGKEDDEVGDVTVDSIEVAQFIYLMLHNEKIRDAIDTIGKKGVLLLGRFTEDRIEVLKALRKELRKRGFMPMVFNFGKPKTKDFTETVRVLAGMSRFVIVDITKPRSSPLELQAIVPDYMIPFVPIIQRGEQPFSMFRDLWNKYRWVLDPIDYPSVDRLIEVMDVEIIHPAQAMFDDLLEQRARELPRKYV